MAKHYVDKKDLVARWILWNETGDKQAWQQLAQDVYKICHGVTVYFCPRDEEEHNELAHYTYVIMLTKIKDGKIAHKPGKGSFFGLLTTAAMRHLYTRKKKEARVRKNLEKLGLLKYIQNGLVSADPIWGH